MLILNKRIIDNFVVSSKDLEQIHLDLLKGSSELFDQMIVAPFRKSLEQHVQSEFPSLATEATDIVEDVILRLRKQLSKKNYAERVAGVKEQLLKLTSAECQLAQPVPENAQKNLGLTRKEFKTLLAALKNGEEQLIERVYLSHFKRCVQYLVYRCGADYDDAYNCTMDALLEIRKDLVQNRIFYGNLDYYFTNRAKGKLFKLNAKRKGGLQAVNIEGMDFEEEERIEEDIVGAEIKELVAQALNKLCGDCRQIIRLYYYEDLSLKEIAANLKKTHQAVRKQATRCRDKLRNHLGEKFYQMFSSHL